MVLALVAVVELIRSKGYIGSIVVVVLLVLAIIFNASMSKMLAKMLIDPITNLVTASEKIASGDFEIGVPYESEDELGSYFEKGCIRSADYRRAIFRW